MDSTDFPKQEFIGYLPEPPPEPKYPRDYSLIVSLAAILVPGAICLTCRCPIYLWVLITIAATVVLLMVVKKDHERTKRTCERLREQYEQELKEHEETVLKIYVWNRRVKSAANVRKIGDQWEIRYATDTGLRIEVVPKERVQKVVLSTETFIICPKGNFDFNRWALGDEIIIGTTTTSL